MIAAALLVALAWPVAARAQTDDELRRRIDELQRALDAQARELEALRALLAARAAARAAPVPPAPPADGRPVDAPYDRASQRQAEVLPDVLPVSDFPGSFGIPGTDAALRVGGFVRVNWVTTDKPLGTDDRFITALIPLDGTAAAAGGARTTIMARPSRVNLDLRTPTGVGHMRAFVETDFGGAGNTLRLRHAYGQWRHVTAGQTWSTFADPEAEPDGIDFEGLNAAIRLRQALVRWHVTPADRWRLAVAIEDPQPDPTGATGVNHVPDLVVRARWQPAPGTHVQTAALLRQIRGAPDGPGAIASAAGWGATVSGRVPSPLFAARDQVLFQQTVGSGIGRYVTDLASEGGQDGVYDPAAGTMRTLPVYAGYVGYEHWWTAQLRSSFSLGIVRVDNLDIQLPDTVRSTRRYTTNVIWSPIPRLDLVAELLWGRRIDHDGGSGTAAQTQIGSTFRF